MMAAARAGELDADVLLLEKTPHLGNKLRITGKGRCNITNMQELTEFIQHYGKNGKFLYNCFSKFFNVDLIDFFEKRGVKTVVERGKRVFPKLNKADEVVNCFIHFLKETKVVIKTNFKVNKIITDGTQVIGVRSKNNEIINGNAVVIATGGMSYPHTGSSGDGYILAQDIGHKIIPPSPGLVPLEIEEKFIGELSGLSLKNVELTGFASGKKFIQQFGEMLFTHYGISGPIVLTMSRKIISKLNQGIVTLSINFKPTLTRDILEKRILRELKEYGRMRYKNILRHLLPSKAIMVFTRLSNIPADKLGAEINREERKRIVDQLTNFKLTVRRSRPIEEAIITSGGVALNEVNPKTMESKLIKGLFFCGEILDIDGDTGGYNLQAAFSTGYVAGQNASNR